ncbi:hypothetical protein O1611_g2043 [Lasiodiplodia mahajangana]|uniref:Uncharacterized protein n=1 Tax=Lasiodiplodia mahajangana TaxID=1108764 RepID=A0ACC2JW66_9PEZI|nr:hypothetical protein O1611_g2043 [Lasiodiplodia mahajangana]
MAPRYPLDAAPDADAGNTMQKLMQEFHGPLPFSVLDENEDALLGWLGPMRYYMPPSSSPTDSLPIYQTPYLTIATDTLTSYTMDLAPIVFDLYKKAFSKVPSRTRQLVVFAYLSVVKDPYMTYCRRLLGPRLGLTDDEIENALAGRLSDSLSEKEALAYRLGIHLSTLNGPVDDETWQEYASKLSRIEITTIANIVGGYQWACLLTRLNGDNATSADHARS